MDEDINHPRRRVGEDPKELFRHLPRLAVKPVPKGEDPKDFFRRMSAQRQAAANQGQGQQPGPDRP
jgi:hypothetical protein